MRKLAVVLVAFVSGYVAAEDRVLYRTGFETPDPSSAERPAGWTPEAGGRWDTGISRRGARALRLDLIKEQAKSGTVPQWISSRIPLHGETNVVVSAWLAEDLKFSPTSDFSAHLVVAFYGRDGKKVAVQSRRGDLRIWDDRPRGLPGSPSMGWAYRQAQYRVRSAAKSAQLVFRFGYPDRTRGTVWLDDVVVRCASESDQLSEGPSEDAEFQMYAHTPVSLNLFWPDDPLLFDIVVTGRSKAFEPPRACRLEYEVADYDGFVVARDSVEFDSGWTRPQVEPASRAEKFRPIAKSLVLPKALSDHVGRFFRIWFRLKDADSRTILWDVTNFGVIEYRPLTRAQSARSRFGGYLGPFNVVREWTILREQAKPSKGQTFKLAPWGQRRPLASQQIGLWWYTQSCTDLKRAWPKKDGPINFDNTCVGRYVNWGVLGKGTPRHAMITLLDWWPHRMAKWTADPEFPHRMDVSVYEEWVYRMARHFRGEIDMWKFNWESRTGPHEAEIGRAGCRAIRRADPNAMCISASGLARYEAFRAFILKEDLIRAGDGVVEHYGAADDRNLRVIRAIAEDVRSASKRDGKRRLWINAEFNCPATRDAAEIGGNIFKNHSRFFEAGFDRLYWFAFGGIRYYFEKRQRRHVRHRIASNETPHMRAYHFFLDDPKISSALTGPSPCTYIPLPHVFGLYNYIRYVDFWDDVKRCDLPEGYEGYRFTVAGATTLVLWRQEGLPPATVALRCDAKAYRLVGVTGRSYSITPFRNASVLTLDDRPWILRFPNDVGELALHETQFLSSREYVHPGDAVRFELLLPDALASLNSFLDLDAGEGWSCRAVADSATNRERPVADVAVDSSVRRQAYPLVFRLREGERLRGVVRRSLRVGAPVDLRIRQTPTPRPGGPSLRLVLANHSHKEVSGVLSVEFPSRQIWQPFRQSFPVSIPGRQRTEIRIPMAEHIPAPQIESRRVLGRMLDVRASFGYEGSQTSVSEQLDFAGNLLGAQAGTGAVFGMWYDGGAHASPGGPCILQSPYALKIRNASSPQAEKAPKGEPVASLTIQEAVKLHGHPTLEVRTWPGIGELWPGLTAQTPLWVKVRGAEGWRKLGGEEFRSAQRRHAAYRLYCGVGSRSGVPVAPNARYRFSAMANIPQPIGHGGIALGLRGKHYLLSGPEPHAAEVTDGWQRLSIGLGTRATSEWIVPIIHVHDKGKFYLGDARLERVWEEDDQR